MPMTLHLHGETEREADGRWIAEIIEVPGVICYGATEEEARRNVVSLLYKVLSEQAHSGEVVESLELAFA